MARAARFSGSGPPRKCPTAAPTRTKAASAASVPFPMRAPNCGRRRNQDGDETCQETDAPDLGNRSCQALSQIWQQRTHRDTQSNWKQNCHEDKGGDRARAHSQRYLEHQLEYLQRDRHEDDSQHTQGDEQPNRVGPGTRRLRHFSRYQGRNGRDSQRHQCDLYSGIEIERQCEYRRKQRHENVYGKERPNELARPTEQVSRLTRTRLEFNRKHVQEHARFHQN